MKQDLSHTAQTGRITRSTGSWYDVRAEDGTTFRGRLRGKIRLRELKVTNPLAVGDRVSFAVEDAQAGQVVITDLLTRDNYIVRKSTHKRGHGHMLAANLDQAVVLATLVYPRTSLGFIDRFLVSAEAFRIPARIVFNKQDLLDADLRAYQDEIRARYESIGYPGLVTSTLTGEGIEAFRQLLTGRVTLLSGHSGVGKSSLVNAVAPHLNLRTSAVSDFAQKGVHTTTFAEMFELTPGTFIIDTPGIKELGLLDIAGAELAHYFPEMRALLNECRFHNCQHLREPGCAVLAAVEAGQIAPERYESYLSMAFDDESHR